MERKNVIYRVIPVVVGATMVVIEPSESAALKFIMFIVFWFLSSFILAIAMYGK
jgi:hypothetical protein